MQHALIVEDLPEIRDWLAEVARAAFPDVEVTTAARVDQALARVAERPFDLALIDLGLPDGSGIDVVGALRRHQPRAVPVVVTIYDDDDHLFPALQAGAFGYLLKEQPQETLIAQLLRMTQGEPPLSPPIARRVLSHFARSPQRQKTLMRQIEHEVKLTERETDVLQRVAKGYTLPGDCPAVRPVAAHHRRPHQADLPQAQRVVPRRSRAGSGAARSGAALSRNPITRIPMIGRLTGTLSREEPARRAGGLPWRGLRGGCAHEHLLQPAGHSASRSRC
jgi:DNA-binding NarL/FixJ family response regulator